jgi:radical SAM protein with 4Fe4S-binding SPASM domain
MSIKDSQYNQVQMVNNIQNRNLFLDNHPSHIHLLMIDKCNAKCIMCGGNYFSSKSSKRISLDDYKKIAENLEFEYVSAVILAGAGEPLLNPDSIPIIEYTNQTYPHVEVSITTNGIALSKGISDKLLENNVSTVNISINSATRETFKRVMQVDAFDRVCQNARYLTGLTKSKGRGPILQFSFVANRLNIEELPNLVKLAHFVGARSINVMYCRFYPERIRSQGVKNNEERLLNKDSLYFYQELSDTMVLKAKELAKNYGIMLNHEPLFMENASPQSCTWTYMQLMVGFSGEIYPCGGAEVHFKDKVESGRYDFGNALHEPIEKIWNNEHYQALRLSSQQGDTCLMPECKNCANLMSPNDIRSHIMQWDEDQYTRDGEELFAKGDLQGALEAFSHAVALNPEYAQAYNNLGVVYWKSGDNQRALANFRKALELDPDDPDTVLNLGEMLISQEMNHEAAQILKTYLNAHPQCSAVQDMLFMIKASDTSDEIIKPYLTGPMVSVIVPTYNRPEMLKETIRSILAQNYQDFEIVVVNDCGQDVEAIINELNKDENKIVYIKHSRNKGLAAARNTGIMVSRGKYIAYLDDDDIYYPHHLETLVGQLEKSGYQVAYTDAYRAHQVYKDGAYKITGHDIPYSIDFSKDILLSQNISPVNCFMHTKQCLGEVGLFDEDFHAHEDWELWVRISRKYDFIHIKKVTTEFRWRMDGSTMSSNSRREFLRTMEEIFKRYQSYAQGKAEVIQIQKNNLMYMRRLVAQQQGPPVCSIIIPVFNKLGFTQQCLEALNANTPGELYEVIIIDNASTDGTADFLSALTGNIKVITNKENVGFSKACNQGAEAAQGAYLLFLNNDTEPRKGWLEPLLAILDNDSTVAAAGSRLLFPDGTIQHAGVLIIEDRKLPDPLVARHIYYQQPSDLPDANQLRTYQALTAACLLIRKDSYEKAGGFDTGYWNGYEDIDLCFKLQVNGGRLVYQPESVVVHHESKSGPERFKKVHHNINRLHDRWLGKIKPDIIINTDGTTAHTDANRIQPYVLPVDIKSAVESRPSEKQTDLVSIVILTFNQLKYTKQCVESIERNTPEPHEIIFVDNGSSDGTRNYLEKYAKKNDHDHVMLILNDENKGFAGGNNQGIAQAKGKYIVLLNNDVVVTEHWLERLIAHLKTHPDIGMVGPMSNSVSGPQLVPNVPYGDAMKAMQKFARDFTAGNAGKTTDILRLVGFCLLIKKEVIDVIGGLDENYVSGNFEDDDLCLRTFIAGYKNIIAHDVFIHHYGSMTFKGNAIDHQAAMQGNRQYFAGKWKDIIEVSSDNGYSVHLTKEQQLKKLLEWGEERFSQGDVHVAIKIFERTLHLDRTNPQALNNIGVIQWQLGDTISAMDTFQTALTNNPKDPDAMGNLLQAATETGRFDLINANLLENLKQAQPGNPDLMKLINAQQDSASTT